MNTDSPHSSAANLSVAQAANRLQDALKSLEGALTPMAERLKTLEAGHEDGAALQEDRARLARELDEAKSANADHAKQAEAWAAQEKEFSDLAGETMAELDAVIRQVQHALGHDNGQGNGQS